MSFATSPAAPAISVSALSPVSETHFHGADDALYVSADNTARGLLWARETRIGVSLLFRGVSVAHKHHPCVEVVCRRPSSVLVRQATGVFLKGHVHAIVSLSEPSAIALADALSGAAKICEGVIWADGVPVQAQVFRESVGVVKLLGWAFPEFTVERNLEFAGNMRRAGVDPAPRIELLCRLLRLPTNSKAASLSYAMRRRLDVAMELMAAPPLLIVHNPLYELDKHAAAELIAMLDYATEALGTTVVVTLPIIEMAVYDRLESLVIIGADGHVVYSGRRADMASYFVHRVTHPLHRYRRNSATKECAVAQEIGGTHTRQSNVPLVDHPSSGSLYHSTAQNGADAEEEDQRGSRLMDRATLTLPLRRTVSTIAGPSAAMGGDMRGVDSIPTAADDDFCTADLDGGESAMDHVHLWAAAGVTDRYAVAFFDSEHHKSLDGKIDTHLMDMRGVSSSSWIRDPLVPPSALMKLWLLLAASVRQRAVNVEFYVGWITLTLCTAACVLLEHYQNNNQQGMFNTRGILFFMLAMTLQINQTFIPSYSQDVDRFLHWRESGVAPTAVQLVVIVFMMFITRLVYLAPLAVGIAVILNSSDAGVTISLLGMISWAHIAMVFLTVVLLRDRRVVTVAIGIYDAFQLCFSGFLVNVATDPSKSFSTASLVRYIYGASVKQYLTSRDFQCDVYKDVTASYCYTSEEYLTLEGFSDDSTHHAIVVMAWVGGVATALTFVRMWFM